METITVTEFRLSDPWKHPNANPPAFPYRDISGKAKCFCKREWARKVSVLLKQGYLFCMSQIFPSRISCSSNKRCFDSSIAVCQELLPTQPAWLRICKGSCKVAALILTLFLVLSFTPFFKTKGEGERREKKNIQSFPPTSGNTTVYRCCKLPWVSIWRQMGVNSSPSYPLQKWALADWTNISYLPASPPSWIILGLIHRTTSSAQPRDIDT